MKTLASKTITLNMRALDALDNLKAEIRGIQTPAMRASGAVDVVEAKIPDGGDSPPRARGPPGSRGSLEGDLSSLGCRRASFFWAGFAHSL